MSAAYDFFCTQQHLTNASSFTVLQRETTEKKQQTLTFIAVAVDAVTESAMLLGLMSC